MKKSKAEIVTTQTPEEKELLKKQAELAALENELAQRELELVTFQSELQAFQVVYLRIVGKVYAELDEILAEIAAEQARLRPNDPEIKVKADQARSQAEESAKAAGEADAKKEAANFRPSETLKKLYREFAKQFHPDLANDEEERSRFEKLMSEANQAYKDGDEERLRKLVATGRNAPESVKGDGTAALLVRIIRKISLVQERLDAITTELTELKESSLNQLKLKVEAAKAKGIDLLREMAGFINREITKACQKLAELKSKVAKG